MSKGLGQVIAIKFTEALKGDVSGTDPMPLYTSEYFTPAGVITASGVYSTSYPATYAFDGNPSSGAWRPNAYPCWIQIELYQPVCLFGFRWTSASSSYRPRAFTLYASNDGYEWDTLYSGENPNTSDWHEFIFQSTKKYKIFKWSITTIWSSYMYLYDIQLLEGLGNERAFTVTGQEKLYVNGPLVDKEYIPVSVEPYGFTPQWSLGESLSLGAGENQAIVYLPEIQSTHADKYYPTNTSGSKTTNTIQGSNAWWYRTFLQFDISALLGRAVTKADLYLYCHSWNDNASSGKTNISRVIEEWNELTVTWNNQPPTVGSYLASDVSPIPVNTWGNWTITDLLREWAEGTYPNYGLYIKNLNEGSYRYNWAIRNRKYGDGSFAPYLRVETPVFEQERIYLLDPIEATGQFRVRWSETKPEDTNITIEYSTGQLQEEWQGVTNGEVYSVDTNLWFKITLETEDTQVSPILNDLWLELPEEPKDRVRLIMHPLARFNNVEGDITVAYDQSKGDLQGRYGFVPSFIRSFTPDGLVKKQNPNSEEIITSQIKSLDLSFIEVFYKYRYTEEIVTAQIGSVTIDYIYVGEVNP